MERPWKPKAEQLEAAKGKRVRDLIRSDLKILFCGINPSLYSAAVGHHFARPGNRFWPALHAGGFVGKHVGPFQEEELLESGYGICNVVDRATARADELSDAEILRGAKNLRTKVRRYRPRVLAVLGVSVYRVAFGLKEAVVGEQPERIDDTRLWVLPNPSGLNAHYTVGRLGELFGELRRSVETILARG